MAEKYSDVTAFAQPSSEQPSSYDSSNEYPRTVAVVVTYNREDLLRRPWLVSLRVSVCLRRW